MTNAFTLAIAHINDTHSHFEPTSISVAIPDIERRVFINIGGFSRIATVANHYRKTALKNSDGFLFLHAGDCFQGTLYYSLFKGEANAVLLNMLNLDAMTLGNHELDLGNSVVSRFLDQINFPLLAGNWNVSGESNSKIFPVKGKKQLLAYDNKHHVAQVLIKQFGQFKVAIFGVSLDKMADITMPDADTPFISAKQTIINTIEFIKKVHHTPYIILLSHLGLDQDIKMATAIKGISVIVGGHSHVLQGDFSNVGLGNISPYGRQINDTLIVQAGCHSFALGKLNVTLDEQGHVIHFTGGNYLLLDTHIEQDSFREKTLTNQEFSKVRDYLIKQKNIICCKGNKNIEQVLNTRFKPEVDKLKNDVVAYFPSRLRHIRVPDDEGGSEIAPLVCQGMLEAAKKRGYHADFAIHNAGGVRVSLEQGKLTAAEIAGRLLPFTIDLMIYKPTGKQVYQAIEGAINNATNNGVDGVGDGSFPYTAGLKYTYECNKPKGKRISHLTYLNKDGIWSPIELTTTYSAISTAYTSQGKEGYDALKKLSSKPISIGITLPDSFIEYARTLSKAQAQAQAQQNNLSLYLPC